MRTLNKSLYKPGVMVYIGNIVKEMMMITLKDVNTLGGTCDRCGKAITNVAVINTDQGLKTVGLDCVMKLLGEATFETKKATFETKKATFETKKAISWAIKDAREYAAMKRAIKREDFSVTTEANPQGKLIYYWNDSKGKHWMGLEYQNQEGIRRDMWELIKAADQRDEN